MLIMVGVMLLVFLVAQRFMPKPPPPPSAKQEQPAAPATATSTPPSQVGQVPAPARVADRRAPAAAATKVTQATAEQEVVVDNGLYRITLTNRGAQVKAWVLKQHKDDKGNPLDMVNQAAAAKYGYPLSLYTYDENLRNKLNNALFVPSATGTLQAPSTVTFEFSDGETTAKKSISFEHGYVVSITAEVTHNGGAVAALPAWPAGLGDQLNGQQFASSRIDWLPVGGSIERKAPHEGFIFKSHISDGNTVRGPFHWAGVVDQYFAAVFLPDRPSDAVMGQFHKTIPRNPNEPDEEKRKKDVVSVLGVAVGSVQGAVSQRVFVGPKDLGTLQQVHAYSADAAPGSRPDGPSLEPVIDFGTYFGFIAKPLFLWLKWTHDHWIRNWGWAIVFLTVVINLALFPLRYMGMRSALKMQKVQPEINHIRSKYRGIKFNDPRMADQQREINEVMKREGVNQLAGCLPMLMQLPILIAFYTMLSVANELRHAHWLWVKDLASADPVYLLPILITVSMFVMQRITPMTGMDPAQAKMMQVMMPLMIGGISFTLPAGLGVYWVTGNLIGFLTQWYMNNTAHAKEVREHLAKRAEKKKKTRG
jgi:YidC/Oxa1 family membrane protein insertase